MSEHDRPSRRTFLKSTVAAGAAVATLTPFTHAWAYPDRNIDIVIPTQAGGGADLLSRAFTGVWSKHLNAEFEVDFFPGASGRAGYEVYINRREPDAHNLLFGNMGPELAVLVVQEAPFGFPDDIQYFSHLSVDPSVLFVRADSPFETVDDVIAAGRAQTLSVATSRLPHPASIGALLLAEHTGADFNLVPLAGGRNTIAGVVTGELDFGVLPSGVIAGAGDAVRTLLVWDEENPAPDKLNNAPTMNEHFGTDAPPLVSAWAFGIHTRTIENEPEHFETLQRTSRQAFDDPGFAEALRQANQPLEVISYGDHEACTAMAQALVAQAQRYKDLLTGQA